MIHDLFHVAAAKYADKTAVVGHRTRLSYAELQYQALHLSQELRRLGAEPGDRIAVLLPNSAEAATAIWAALETECVLVPLHAASRSESLLPILLSAEPRWLIAASELSALLRAILKEVQSVERVILVGNTPASKSESTHVESKWIDWNFVETKTTTSADRRVAHSADSALAAVIYTSGSTGLPKGVMLSHDNMQAAVRAVQSYLQLRSDDVLYSALPLSSSYGLYQLIMGLAVGGTVLLDRSFSFPAQSLALLASECATVFAGVPTMFALLANTTLLDKHDLSRLRILTSAAAALPMEHARRVHERLPRARLFVMYGQTECKRISYLDPDDLFSKPGSVGRGMPYQEHTVVDESGRPVAPGEVGELVVRGEHVMSGYWHAPEETARKLRPLADGGENWLHTDDLFRIDAEGYLYFVGRRDDILKIGGNKVSPREVEEVLAQMPEILESAVIGIPDSVWGEAVQAHVVVKPGANCTADEVIRFCKPRLRGFMVPKEVKFAKALPKTESGKIKKRDLI